MVIGQAMAASPGVVEVHDLHVWEVTSGFPARAAHVQGAPGDDCHARRRQLQTMLRRRFDITHTTLQVDHADSSTTDSGLSDPDCENPHGARHQSGQPVAPGRPATTPH